MEVGPGTGELCGDAAGWVKEEEDDTRNKELYTLQTYKVAFMTTVSNCSKLCTMVKG